MTNPTPHDAALSLAEAERATAHVRGGSSRFAAWLVGMSAATMMYYVGLAAGGNDAISIVTISVVFAVVAAALSFSLLLGANVARRGFSIRWGIAVGVWGGVFGAAVGLGLGLPIFLGEFWFWIPAGIVTVAPLAWGTWAELRA